jgi:hypothetical protein
MPEFSDDSYVVIMKIDVIAIFAAVIRIKIVGYVSPMIID